MGAHEQAAIRKQSSQSGDNGPLHTAYIGYHGVLPQSGGERLDTAGHFTNWNTENHQPGAANALGRGYRATRNSAQTARNRQIVAVAVDSPHAYAKAAQSQSQGPPDEPQTGHGYFR
jgi:hypothetical protein